LLAIPAKELDNTASKLCGIWSNLINVYQRLLPSNYYWRSIQLVALLGVWLSIAPASILMACISRVGHEAEDCGAGPILGQNTPWVHLSLTLLCLLSAAYVLLMACSPEKRLGQSIKSQWQITPRKPASISRIHLLPIFIALLGLGLILGRTLMMAPVSRIYMVIN